MLTTTAQQESFFQREGYRVVPQLLKADEFTECRQEIERLHKGAVRLLKCNKLTGIRTAVALLAVERARFSGFT